LRHSRGWENLSVKPNKIEDWLSVTQIVKYGRLMEIHEIGT